MITQHTILYRRLVIAADAVLVGISFFLTYYFLETPRHLFPLSEYVSMLPFVVLLWVYLLYSFGIYKLFRLKKTGEIIAIVLKTAVFGFFIFSTALFSLKIVFLSRYFIGFFFILSAFLIMLEKIVFSRVFRYLSKKSPTFRNLLVVGTGPRAQKFIAEAEHNRELGLKIIGLIDEASENRPKEVLGHKVIGCLDDIPRIIREQAIDIVVFIVPRSLLGHIEGAILYCETVGVGASVAVDLFDLKFSKGKADQLFGTPLLTFGRTTDKIGHLLFKRFLDLILSAAALVVISPLMVLIAVLIKTTSKGQVFFKQKRIGLNGRTFTFFKFRTMVADAEEKLESLRHHNEMAGPVFKMSHDPRITRLGLFLRKFSLDELPQLWNVFKGEMSLVGPRPPVPKEVNQYDHWQRRRLSMRPGLTCLWQVNGRNNIKDFNHWMKLDLEYIDNWSLWLDLKILFKTIPVVLFGVGAK